MGNAILDDIIQRSEEKGREEVLLELNASTT
jgi:hypothetical protein